MQNPGGIRGPQVVPQGGSITVAVSTGDHEVTVGAAGSGRLSEHDVTTDGSLVIPVPNVPAGTILTIAIGRGLRSRVIFVEVIGTE